MLNWVTKRRFFLLILMAAAFTGCSLVDEDMRDCESDYNIDYTLTLVTNISTEISTELQTLPTHKT